MELSTAIAGRRSTRNYTAAPVSEKDLREIIAAATFAPSAMNEQPCRFTVVTGRGLLKDISDGAKTLALETFGKGAHAGMLTDPDFDLFYGAPALVVISAPAKSQWLAEDCALAAENLMLAAYARNLGTCWVGFSQAWLGTKDGRGVIGLDPLYTPVAPIIVGHAQAAMPPVPRREPHIDWIK